ncbi:MAG: CHASE2 domain-containing protein [Cyanobacteria bacterium P01_G01_bin.54]
MTDLLAHNQETLSQLLWAVEMTQPQSFTLLFAECDSLAWRSRWVEQFKARSPLTVSELTLPPSVRVPYHQIRGELGESMGETVPEVLFIYGLEAVNEPTIVLQALNNARDLFARDLPFPVVFWLTSDLTVLQSRIAKDWDSWGRTLTFAVDVAEQRDWLLEVCDRAYALGLETGAAPYKSKIRAIAGDAGNFGRAWAAVQAANLEIDPAAQARILLVQGLLSDDHQHKYELYQQSLDLWEQCDPTPTVQTHRALTLFYAGKWWLGAAKFNRLEREQAYTEARQLWEAALELWTGVDRLDLVARFINPLGELYQWLGAWDELAALTARSQQLHHSYPEPAWQAHDLGILAASGALQRQDWARAVELTTEALTRLEDVSLQTPAYQWTQKFHRGWYWLNRAIALWAQGERDGAIADLEAAREQTKAKSDPYLYFRILETLRSDYFSQQQYLDAFEVKQHQQTVEFQFNFRAFVGAGRLQSQRHERTDAELQRLVSEEINASGREQDIQALVKRVKEPRHRLTIIYGASGVGKSSLIRAALLPTLRQDDRRTIIPVLQSVYTDWQTSLASSMASAFSYLGFNSQHLFNAQSALSQEPSLESVIEQLRLHGASNILTVLIFDQFEEFLLAHREVGDRLPFYAFLKVILNLPSVKVILAMRSDYLHYLLECNDRELVGLDVVNHDILSTDILYYLGKFSPQQARDVIERLTGQARSGFAPELVDALITDLQGTGGKIRPIELQVVGAQLQTERVATLGEYRAKWDKEKLVEKYLTDIVADCGPENEGLAWNILDLLIDPKREVRPIRTRSELEQLGADEGQLDLVLTILHGSQLIFRYRLDVADEERFQLVHDYLVEPIRERKENKIRQELAEAREYRQITEARKLLFTAQEFVINATTRSRKQPLEKLPFGTSNLWLNTLGIVIITISLRWLGLFQAFELSTFDFLVRLRPPEEKDERILIVEITEEDIQESGTWPISDSQLNLLLRKIDSYRPRLIGLCIYRDLPVEPGHEELIELFQEVPNLIGIESFQTESSQTVLPPPMIPPKRIGFNNIAQDNDTWIRRALLYVHVDSKPKFSMAMRFIFLYLEKEGIEVQWSNRNPEWIQINRQIFPHFTPNYGPYIREDNGGYQIMLNFRDPRRFDRITMKDLLDGKISKDLIRDRIVITGYSAASVTEQRFVPYSSRFIGTPQSINEVTVHASIVSVLLSAALDDRPPTIRSLPEWGEWLVISIFVSAISLLSWRAIRLRSHLPQLYVVSLLLIWVPICYLACLIAWFIPLVPVVFAGVLTALYLPNATRAKVTYLELLTTLDLLKTSIGPDREMMRLALEYCAIQHPNHTQEIQKFLAEYDEQDKGDSSD